MLNGIFVFNSVFFVCFSNREEFVHLIQRLKDRVPIAPPVVDDVLDEDSSNSLPQKPLVPTPETLNPDQALSNNKMTEKEIAKNDTTEVKVEAVKSDPEETEPPVNKVASLKITLKKPSRLTSPEKHIPEKANKNEETKDSDDNQKLAVKQVTNVENSTRSAQSPLKITISGRGRNKKVIEESVKEASPVNEVSPVKEPTPVRELTPPPPPSEIKQVEKDVAVPLAKKGRRGRSAQQITAEEKSVEIEVSPPKKSANTRQVKETKSAITPMKVPAKTPVKRVGRSAKRARRSTRNKHESDNSDEVGEEIEDPILHVSGEGSGADNEGIPFECTEAIEEPILYFYGEGTGHENLVGNTDNKEVTKTPTAGQNAFFFGAPGCLKNTPVGSAGSSLFGSSSTFGFGGQTAFGSTKQIEQGNAVINDLDFKDASKTPPIIEITAPETPQSDQLLKRINAALESSKRTNDTDSDKSYGSSATSFLNRLRDVTPDTDSDTSPKIISSDTKTEKLEAVSMPLTVKVMSEEGVLDKSTSSSLSLVTGIEPLNKSFDNEILPEAIGKLIQIYLHQFLFNKFFRSPFEQPNLHHQFQYLLNNLKMKLTISKSVFRILLIQMILHRFPTWKNHLP